MYEAEPLYVLLLIALFLKLRTKQSECNKIILLEIEIHKGNDYNGIQVLNYPYSMIEGGI